MESHPSQEPSDHDSSQHEDEGPIEIAITGDLTDHEGELTERILGVDPGEECTLYFDSPGGSPYCAMSLMTLIKMRRLRATGIITGECSSAALWPYAACERRIVTPYSVLLFHPMRWQSEENVGLAEAAEWARHFGDLERSMDDLLAQMFGADRELMAEWINPGRYVSGKEMADAGLAEMVQFNDLPSLMPGAAPERPATAGSTTAARNKGPRPAAAAKRGN